MSCVFDFFYRDWGFKGLIMQCPIHNSTFYLISYKLDSNDFLALNWLNFHNFCHRVCSMKSESNY